MKDKKLKKELIDEYNSEEKEIIILDNGIKVKRLKIIKKNWLDKIIKNHGKDIRV